MNAPFRTDINPARHRGPILVLVAGVHVALFFCSLVISTMLASGQHFPSVFAPADQSARYFVDHRNAVQVLAFLQFGAAIPLGVFAASISSRLQFLGMRVAGTAIGFFGGVGASLFVALSAIFAWTLAQPGIAETPGLGHALHLLCFAAGGPGYLATSGLLLAGVAFVAGLQGFAPRWLMWTGLAIALTSELSILVLLVPAAGILLPIARFTGFLWMIAVSVALPKTKGTARSRTGSPASLREAPQA